MWKELIASKCVTAFSAVVTGALLDLNKCDQSGAFAKNRLKGSKQGLTFSDPATEAEWKWRDCFTALEIGVGALARVMEICPLSFSKEIAATPLMQQLQKIFKMDALPSALRTNTAFILYSMTCAKDTEASKLLNDCVTRAAIRDILQEHELTLNPGGDRYPWTLEQLFAYVSRGLVVWASSVGPEKGKVVDRSHLVVVCSARIPEVHLVHPSLDLRRPRKAAVSKDNIVVPYGEGIGLAADDLQSEDMVEPPATFTFDSQL